MKTFVFLGLLGLVAADQITSLPGAPAANFNQYSGYFKVGKNNGHNMHYWLVESQGNPSTDPVLLWLTGGPGCSGLSALLTEWGPYMVNPDGATLTVNPYAWNRNATVLVLESPIGVGFSYADNGNTDTDDNQVANENWEALCEFFTTFPQFANNDFYVTGESYGGIYVPTLVQTILDNQSKQHINIKGFAIGNGCVSFPEGTDALIDFEYAHGMIDDVKWAKVRKECCKNDTDDCQFHSMNGFGFCPSFANEAANQAWYSGINPYNMYSNCYNGDGFVPKRFIHEAKFRTGLPMPEKLESVPCLDERPVTNYLNRPDVRAALFISNKSPKWEICSELNYNRIYTDMTSRVQNAIAKGLKGLLYSGDVDMACNFLMGQRFTRKLGLKQTHVKKAYNVNGQNAGFHTQYGNMAFVTARGAGHMVPTDKPAVAFHIIDSFLNNRNY